MNTPQAQPWYRQFWPWFLITLPGIAVIASVYTLFIAIENQPSMVNDNYYQEGLSINERIKQDQQATELSISANLLFSEQSNKVSVYLSGMSQPVDTLILAISAPDDDSKDRTYMLKLVNTNLFSSVLPDLPQGRFYISLEPQQREWRLLGEITLPRQDTLVLTGRVNSDGVDN